MLWQNTEALSAYDKQQRRFKRTLVAAALFGWLSSGPAAEPPKAASASKKCDPVVQPTPEGDESVEWSGLCRAGKMFGKGVMTWRLNGEKQREFEGELVNSLPQGKGVMQWSDGRRFEGAFVAGEPFGNGALTFSNRDRFEGAVLNGLPEGRGRVLRANGDRYDGTFSAGQVQGSVDYAFGGPREGERFVGPVDNKHEPNGEGTYFERDGSSFAAALAEGKIVAASDFKYPDGARWQGAVVGNRPHGHGVLVLANGDRIEGRLAKDQFASGAIYHFAKGGRFIGTLSGNRPRGAGWLILASGERIQGELSGGESGDAKISGTGQIFYADGRVYGGPIEGNQPQGRGVLTLPGGEKIEADFRGVPAPQGNIALEYPNGDRYAGDLSGVADLLPHGRGVLTTRAGHKYSGSFAKGLPDGKVEVVYVDGRKYEGDYVAGERSGQGVFRWPDGVQYEGAFAAGLPHGKGNLSGGNGGSYSGDFAAGLPGGNGRLELLSGKVIDGTFRDGVGQGKATLTMPDKSRFIGTLAADRLEGQGSYVGADGKKSEFAFTADLPKADDGPFFGIFKSKLEELTGLIDAGFYPWAQRYYLANRKYFEDKKAESAPLYARLRNGLAEGFAWREKYLRKVAQLPLLDAGRLRGDQDLAKAGRFAEEAAQQQAAARAVPLLADGFGVGQGNPVEEFKPAWSAAYAEALATAIAAGRLDEADRISQAAGERKLQPINKAVDAALSALVARDPLLLTTQQAAFDRLREDGVELDKALIEGGLIAALEAAIRDGDVDKAFTLLGVGQKLEFRLLAGERGSQFARLLAQRVGGKADPEAGFALLVAALEALKAHGDGLAAGELHGVWLEMFARRVDKGEVKLGLEALAKVGELGLKLALPKEAAPAVVEINRARLVSALGKRLDAYDAAGWLLAIESLAADGVDLTPAFKKKVVFLRTGAIGSRTPFALSVKNDGLFRFKVLDDLLEYEDTLREDLAGVSHVLIADIHPRLAVRRFASRSDVASTFPDGAVDVPNPAYQQLEQQIAEADAAAARAGQKSGGVNLPTNSGNRNADNIMGLLNVIGAIADASSAGDAAEAAGKAQALRNRLATTPRTLSKPKSGSYKYQQAEIEALQIVPATLYLLDLPQKQYVRRPLAFAERESFETAFGIHPKDKGAKSGERPDRVRQLERKPLSLSLSDLILAPAQGFAELLGEEAGAAVAPAEPLANLPAVLDETREKRDTAALRWLEAETRKFEDALQQILSGLHDEGRQRSEPIMEVLRIPSEPSPEVTRNGAKLGHLLVRAAGPVVAPAAASVATAAPPAGAPAAAATAASSSDAAVQGSTTGQPASR